MGWVSAFAIGGAVLLAIACGPAFTVGPGGPGALASDSAAFDASHEGDEADVATEAWRGGPAGSDDASDATGGDDSGHDNPPVGDAEPPPPHCGGQFACTPRIPAGWTGPLELYAGPKAPAVCSAHFLGPSYAGSADLIAPGASCSCQCGAPQNVRCSVPTVSFYGSPMCGATNSPCATVDLSPSACTSVDKSANCLFTLSGLSMSAPASRAVGGSCGSLPASAVAIATWGTNARACISGTAPVQADCLAGEVCAPSPGMPYSAALCVSHAGDVACPTTDYVTRQVFYGAVDDTRGCSACSCGGVTGASCAASFDVYASMSTGTCGGSKITYQAPVSCAPVQQPASFLLTLSPSAGSCIASSNGPIGSATPTRPTTMCCL